MAFNKLMILVGTLLLVPTCSSRIKQAIGAAPHEPQEMIDARGEEMVEQDQDELATALVEEDSYNVQSGKAGEDAADQAEEVLTRSGWPVDQGSKSVAALAAAAADDALEEAGPLTDTELWAELVVEAEQAAASRRDLIRQRKDKANGKKGKGKYDEKAMFKLVRNLAERKKAKQDDDEFALAAPEKKGPEKKAQWVNPARWMAQMLKANAEDKAKAQAKKAERTKERAKKAAGDEPTVEQIAAEEAVQASAEDASIAARFVTAADINEAVMEAIEQAIDEGPVHDVGDEAEAEQDSD